MEQAKAISPREMQGLYEKMLNQQKLQMSAVLEGYELCKSKLASLEREHQQLYTEFLQQAEQIKELEGELEKARPKKKQAKK